MLLNIVHIEGCCLYNYCIIYILVFKPQMLKKFKPCANLRALEQLSARSTNSLSNVIP
jgi:hypothetical protein